MSLTVAERVGLLASTYGIVVPVEIGVYDIPCPACKPIEGIVDPKRRTRLEAKCLQVEILEDRAKWICMACGIHGGHGGTINGQIDSGDVRKWKSIRATAPIALNPTEDWSETNAYKRLLRRGISAAAIARCNISYEYGVWISRLEELTNALAFPYYQRGELVAVRYVTSDGIEEFHHGERASFFGIDDITYTNDDGSAIPQDVAFIVPNEMSKLAMETAGYTNVIALPYSSPTKGTSLDQYFQFIERAGFKLNEDDELGLLDSIATVYIAMDSDKDGQRMEDELIRRLGPDRCIRVRWPMLPLESGDMERWDKKKKILHGDVLLDANETLFCLGVEGVQQAIRDAKPIPIDGVFRVEDFAAEIWEYYYKGLPPGYAISDKSFGRAFKNSAGESMLHFQTRTTCIWTGIPGHGKSRMMENCTVDLATHEGFKWIFFSPEVNPLQLFATYLMSQYAGLPFNLGATGRMNEEVVKQTLAWLHDHFWFLKAGMMPFSIDDLLERATKVVTKHGVNGMVIDPWNNVYHSRKAFEREDEYIGQALQKINAWRDKYNVLVHIVAHPTKLKSINGSEPVPTLNDIKGGSEFFSMADFGFSVWRNRADEKTNTQIHIQKTKFQHLATLGKAELKFDKPTSKFYDADVPFGGVPTKQYNKRDAPIFDQPDYRTEDNMPPWMQGDEYDV